jgi:hypothetical protein
MKRIIAAGILVMLWLAPAAVFADSIYDLVGDTLAAGKVQVEYNEKFFEYDNYNFFKDDVYNKILDTIDYNTTTFTVTGMYQDFVLKVGLPGGYGLTADFDYIYQNLGDLYNYNNVQSVGFIFSKEAFPEIGILAGMRFPMKLSIADDPRLITPFTSPSVVAGFYSKGSFDVLNYNFQAAFEQPLAPAAIEMHLVPDIVKQGAQGNLNISGSLGYSIYGNKETQSVELAVEAQYLEQQYSGYNALAIRVVPQARVYFYNDFYFILGVEKLLYTEDTLLNNQDTVIYLAKVNYMLNSDNRIIASGNSLNARGGYGSGVSPTASALTGQATPTQVTATPTATH